jgi:hypothetical protein
LALTLSQPTSPEPIFLPSTPATGEAAPEPTPAPAAPADNQAAQEKTPQAPDVPAPSSLAAAPNVAPTEAAQEKVPPPNAPVPSSLAAVPAPPAEAPMPTDAPAKPAVEPDEVTFTFGPRQWRVRGVGKNLAFDTLRVQLRVLVQHGNGQHSFHLDTLDLCNAKHRNAFIAQAHAETRLDENLLKRDLAAAPSRSTPRDARPAGTGAAASLRAGPA